MDDYLLHVLTILHSRLSEAGATIEIVIGLQNILHDVQKLKRDFEAVKLARGCVDLERVRTIYSTESWKHLSRRPRKQINKKGTEQSV